jgi:hypothetical protein
MRAFLIGCKGQLVTLQLRTCGPMIEIPRLSQNLHSRSMAKRYADGDSTGRRAQAFGGGGS